MEEAVKTLPLAPTVSAVQPVEVPTMRFPVEVESPASVFNLPGKFQVQVPVEEVIYKLPSLVEEEKVPAKYKVLSAERFPPPDNANPVLIALVLDTASMPKVSVLSADKSPPPKRGAVVFMALVEDTALIPKESVIAPVFPVVKIGAVTATEDTKEEPRLFCLPSKVSQSVADRKPVSVAEEVATLQVKVELEEETMKSPGAPEVAKVKLENTPERVPITPFMVEEDQPASEEPEPPAAGAHWEEVADIVRTYPTGFEVVAIWLGLTRFTTCAWALKTKNPRKIAKPIKIYFFIISF